MPQRIAGVALRDGGRHPFGVLDRYLPLDTAQIPLYRAVREAVPIVDAALSKLIRLVGVTEAEIEKMKNRELTPAQLGEQLKDGLTDYNRK